LKKDLKKALIDGDKGNRIKCLNGLSDNQIIAVGFSKFPENAGCLQNLVERNKDFYPLTFQNKVKPTAVDC
jgi:hypothetical protein